MIRQISHLQLITDQPAALVGYYTEILGLSLAFTVDDDAAGGTFGWVIACGAQTFIEIFDRRGAGSVWGNSQEPLHHGNRYRHMALEVVDLPAFCQTLRQRGGTVSSVTMGRTGSWQAWVKDPDGNDIELLEYTPTCAWVRSAAAVVPPLGDAGS